MEANYCKVMYKFLNWQLTSARTWRKLCEFWACSISWSGWRFYISDSISGLPWWLRWVNNPTANAGDVGLIPGSGRSPGAGNGNPLSHTCPFHGQRSLAGYSPLCCKESDMKEQLNTTLYTVYTEELGRSFQVLIILYNTQPYHRKNKVAPFSKCINSFRP